MAFDHDVKIAMSIMMKWMLDWNPNISYFTKMFSRRDLTMEPLKSILRYTGGRDYLYVSSFSTPTVPYDDHIGPFYRSFYSYMTCHIGGLSYRNFPICFFI